MDLSSDDLVLIEFVKNHKCLYDIENTHYNDYAYKQKVWKEIADVLEYTLTRVKTRWESLRNQFRRYMRKKRTTAEEQLPKWKYYDDLSFLLPHTNYQAKRACATVLSDEIILNQSEDDSMYENAEHTEDFKDEVHPATEKADSDKACIVEYVVETKKRKLSDNTRLYLRDDHDGENIKDELDLFFDTMKATVRKFSESNKIIAKQKVFSAISELEAINLTQRLAEAN